MMAKVEKAALRAIYYEDEEDQFRAYVGHLTDVLQANGGRAEVTRVRTRDELRGALASRPHVVFSDNEHGAGREQEGIQAIAALKPKHPDTLFCLVSRRALRVNSFGSFTPNPDLIISKAQLGTPEYDAYISSKLRKAVKRVPLDVVKLDFDLAAEGPKVRQGPGITSEEIRSIIEQVVDTEGTSVFSSDHVSAQLSVVPGGFSGAGVYLLRILKDDGKSNVPSIIKISERPRAVVEYENFLRFVKWRLPYLWRVDVLGTGFTGRFGAICYSIARGGAGEPRPVNQYIRDGEGDVIDRVLSSILDRDNQTWYEERRKTGKDARDYFSGERFYRKNARREVLEAGLIGYISELFGGVEDGFINLDDDVRIFEKRYPKPGSLIFSQTWGEVTECVCHGDLNGNNMLYGGDGSPVVFIDFQDTGFWHVFRDFVTFEMSVRLEQPDDRLEGESDVDLLKRYLEYEKDLVDQCWAQIPRDRGYVSYISDVRMAANSNFGDENLALYLIANVVHSMWIFEKSGKWESYKRLRLAATILESLRGLANIRKSSEFLS